MEPGSLTLLPKIRMNTHFWLFGVSKLPGKLPGQLPVWRGPTAETHNRKPTVDRFEGSASSRCRHATRLPLLAMADRTRSCWHCRSYAGLLYGGSAASCKLVNGPRVRSMPATGCASFERVVGAGDKPVQVPVVRAAVAIHARPWRTQEGSRPG